MCFFFPTTIKMKQNLQHDPVLWPWVCWSEREAHLEVTSTRSVVTERLSELEPNILDAVGDSHQQCGAVLMIGGASGDRRPFSHNSLFNWPLIISTIKDKLYSTYSQDVLTKFLWYKLFHIFTEGSWLPLIVLVYNKSYWLVDVDDTWCITSCLVPEPEVTFRGTCSQYGGVDSTHQLGTAGSNNIQ